VHSTKKYRNGQQAKEVKNISSKTRHEDGSPSFGVSNVVEYCASNDSSHLRVQTWAKKIAAEKTSRQGSSSSTYPHSTPKLNLFRMMSEHTENGNKTKEGEKGRKSSSRTANGLCRRTHGLNRVLISMGRKRKNKSNQQNYKKKKKKKVTNIGGKAPVSHLPA
jgi:hypothetical protein